MSMRRGLMALGLLLVMLAVTSCRQNPAPPPTPALPALDTLPENDAAVLVKTEDGGTVGLRDGASVVLPRQSLTESTLVTLRVLREVPAAPIPRSIIGRVYDISLEGGAMAGIATLTLPLPANVTPEEYDLGAYQWDGRTWYRMESRVVQNQMRLGIEQPGTYAVLGSWRMADAALTLAIPPGDAGRATVPVEVRGQYRFAAPPNMQHDYVEARLTLKRDSSGGAGQVNGVEGLDATVGEAVLWFKPDPGQSEGVIDFNYTFQIDPAGLDVALGTVNLFYATLNVDDSPAPTRRLSTAVDYTVLLPIKAVGTDVVRPELSENSQPLVWHVRLNGQTLFRRPAPDPTLSLADVLAQGGLGEYRITLEAEYQGRYVPVSNEVTVQLAVPGTFTPAAVAQGSQPGAATPTPWPFGTMPPTPTRRAPPAGTPSPLEGPTRPVTATLAPGVPTPTPTPTPTATRATGSGTFWSERESVAAGECTVLHWNVQNVAAVYLDGSPTTGVNTRQVCPSQSASYTLRAIDQQGRTQEWRVVVSVLNSGALAQVDFMADSYQVVQGQCTTLRWRVENVTGVFLNDEGVAGEATREVCPQNTTTYVLRVRTAEGDTSQRLTVWVLPSSSIPIQFWSDQYMLEPGACTTIHWSVQNVDEVFLQVPGQQEQGVAGIGAQQVCPHGSETYALTAKVEERSSRKELVIQASDVQASLDEVIAQGVVIEVAEESDLDPNTAGDLNGFRVKVDGITPLRKGFDSCCESSMTLLLTKALMSGQYQQQLDWPIHVGQLIEFRFTPCTSGECRIFAPRAPFYLKARSE